jgi:hypothetical protein
MKTVMIFAVRSDKGTIDLAAHDEVGEATCPSCRVKYQFYVRHEETVRLGEHRVREIAARKIPEFETYMRSKLPTGHTDSVHVELQPLTADES